MNILEKRVQSLHLENSVTFTGFVKDNREVDTILASCYVGIAPYRLTENSFKPFTDPGKIKSYLGVGLPIVMTNVSHIADVIRKREVGLVITDTKKDIIQAIESLFSDSVLSARMKRNTMELAKEYDWNIIYSTAFTQLEHRGEVSAS